MSRQTLDRRRFLTGAAATAGVVSLVRPLVSGAAAARPLQIGSIGCGGRGSFLAGLFAKHGGYRIVAAHDYFPDRVNAFAKAHNVPPERRFTGLDGYQRLLACNLDAVVIASPPFFHPGQAAAAVAAGKHVYVAKPIAVDVPGCHTIEAAGRQATERKQVFLVDFQTRANGFFVEAVKRVHDGALGTMAFGESTYHSGRLGKKGEDQTPEGRLRNWVFDKALSGDIITEQNIHTLDVMSWIMNTPPLRATGTGGRTSRVDVGDCWDHFVVTYEYANQVGVAFSSRQFDAHGTKPDGIRCRFFGNEGVIEAQYGGDVLIRGKSFYRGGNTGNIYVEGARTNIAAFHEKILSGDCGNPTVAQSVRSNLVTILGRTAAYTGHTVTWDELLAANQRLDGRLEDLKR